jgi:thiamine biosynthesis protein ThiI
MSVKDGAAGIICAPILASMIGKIVEVPVAIMKPKAATVLDAKGIVTGESLGQVASRTLDNLVVLTDAASDVPIYRPLIGFDKEDAIRIAREIGTFTESISHASGCKAVPVRPSTRAKLETIREIEEKLEAGGIPVPV